MVLPSALEFRSGCLNWSRPYVMGVLNLTPDSFSDGGQLVGLEGAIRAAEEMVADGADILDIGGESTRPGALPVSIDEECRRILPLVEALAARFAVPLSVDTCKAEVARRAVAAGAEIVNDVSGGLFDESMIERVDSLGCAFVCGHVRGRDLAAVHATLATNADEVLAELVARIASLPLGLRARTIADPCIGFGKDLHTNLGLLRSGEALAAQTGCPVLIGASRKRFLGELTGLPVHERDAASVGAALASVEAGAHILRVHNVAMTVSALRVFRVQEVAA